MGSGKNSKCADPSPGIWGLGVSPKGELTVGPMGVLTLAREYGTPVHVVNRQRLADAAAEFLGAVRSAYPGKVSVHYALKCNSVPAVVSTLHSEGLSAEVMTEFELALALRLGYSGEQIIVNGPCKTADFLRRSLLSKVRLIIIDSLQELESLITMAQEFHHPVNVLLRVNPDFVPRRMNRGTATGSRRGSAFGLDLKGGEVETALGRLRKNGAVKFLGFHLHIGTGVQFPQDYARALSCLTMLVPVTRRYGFRIEVLDVGGGFAAASSRELTTKEMLLYQAIGKLPERGHPFRRGSLSQFAEAVSSTVLEHFQEGELPELIYEPGRCITSSSQFLLLTVHRVKERKGAGTWLIADGGLSTVTMPTYYEYHEVFLCNDVTRPRTDKVTIIGPACFAGDVVYRNKLMPVVRPGEVIAIMDSGAYFTALESSFGFPHPAIVFVEGSTCRLVRARESFDDMIARDVFGATDKSMEVQR